MDDQNGRNRKAKIWLWRRNRAVQKTKKWNCNPETRQPWHSSFSKYFYLFILDACVASVLTVGNWIHPPWHECNFCEQRLDLFLSRSWFANLFSVLSIIQYGWIVLSSLTTLRANAPLMIKLCWLVLLQRNVAAARTKMNVHKFSRLCERIWAIRKKAWIHTRTTACVV